MIVCGKCGFTQPKDVYCANCGINLEKYKPEKPPKLKRLLKDPYFQISSAIIAAVAAFFIFINKPVAPIDDVVFDNQGTEFNETKQVDATDSNAPKEKQLTKKTKAPSLKKIVKQGPVQIESKNKIKVLDTDLNEADKTLPEKESSLASSGVKKATYNFYEVLPSQVEKYFTGNSKVEASVISAKEFDPQNFSASRLPVERNWDLSKSKSMQLDYMIESIEDGELRGIKFSVTHNSPDGELSKNIKIRVNANIPNKEGSGSSIDWSRSLSIDESKVLLLKVQLPHNELPASFVEETYNSPLSIMSSPQFLDQKTLLLSIIRFE